MCTDLFSLLFTRVLFTRLVFGLYFESLSIALLESILLAFCNNDFLVLIAPASLDELIFICKFVCIVCFTRLAQSTITKVPGRID